MQYKYVAVYQIRGLTHAPGSGDTEIYTFEGSTSVKAFLSYDIDAQCYELDRARAISYLMLKGLASKSWDDSKPEIEAEITRIRENRRKNLEDAEALVVVATGETEPQFSDSIKETDEFVLGFDVVTKDELFDTHRSQANAAVTALCLATVHDIIQVKKLCEGVYLINESGKPVYSFSFSGGGEVYSSRRTTTEVTTKARSQAKTLAREKTLSRVNRLLVQAISRDNDKLRRFISGWSALEILVNKVFSEYEKLFIQNLIGTAPTGHTQRYFDRIRDVMQGKYRITDKFVIVAACLGDNESTESDIDDFESIKEKRDSLLHGNVIDESSLPINETIRLLKKYLSRHIDTKAP